MKAIRLHGINDLRLDQIAIPKSDQNEILLRTASVGICGSDIHYLEEGGTGGQSLQKPLVLGHEFSAWIETGAQKGTLAAIDPALTCGHCEFCHEGNPNFCVDIKFAGAEGIDGGLREYLVWPKSAVYPLPRTFKPEDGALLEPLGVAIHAARLGKLEPGMAVGVFGTGPIGLLTIQLAKLSGATRIFATDRIESHLEIAKQCGATDILLANGRESEKILSATDGRGLDVTFEAAGDDGTAVETAIQATKPGGTAVLIGIPSENTTCFTASAARRRGLTIKLARRMKNTFPTAINLVSAGMVKFKPLITHTFPPEKYFDAFKTAAQRKGVKVFIKFD